MAGLGAMMTGGNGKRAKDDFYPTPPDATRALLPLIADFPSRLWEPACGDGAIQRVLMAGGFNVYGTDIVDRGWSDDAPSDFLTTTPIFRRPFGIVTNPPFKLAAQFIDHACGMTPYVAMLLKATFWNAAVRAPLFAKHPPAAIHPLTWRLDFFNLGAPTMDCAWCVWRPGAKQTVFAPIGRPAPVAAVEDLLT